jgi:uncharacterized protein (TIGR00255 family)
MTGFGRKERQIDNKLYIVELRSLNGKQLDLNLKIPSSLKAQEATIRQLLSNQLIRGTVECNIMLKQDGSSKPMSINKDLFKAYYETTQDLSKELELPLEQIIPTILRMPEVVSQSTDVIEEEDWEVIQALLLEAIEDLKSHRQAEGVALEKDMLNRIQNILNGLENVKTQDPERIQRTRDRITNALQQFIAENTIDQNRLEQELIYYIEKLDISEECVRLEQHCQYFLSILNDDQESKGKKLGFILQEIGREINTTGSKANDAVMQRTVVNMKDELEKLKEQSLNVL